MNVTSKREPKDLVDNKRWMAYAAASAAGALVCQGAEADIIHVTVNQVLNAAASATSTSNSISATFAVGAAPSAFISFSHMINSSGGRASFRANGVNAMFAGAPMNGYPYALNLAAGQNVSTAGVFLPGSGTMAVYGGYPNSQFKVPGIGFLGFTFSGGDMTQYGWARVNMDGVVNNNSLTIIDYAYTDEGEDIRAGQTSIPEPGSLGLLAAGAAGLAIARRRRSKKSGS